MRDQQLVFENSAPTGTPMTPPSANSSTEHTPSELDTRTNQTTVEGRLGTTDTNADSGGQKRKRGPWQKPRRPTLREETPAGPLKRKRITLCVPCTPATLTPAPPVIGGESEQAFMGEPINDETGQVNTSQSPCNYGSVMSSAARNVYSRLVDLAKLLRIPASVKKGIRINRRCGKHKLASISATRADRKAMPKSPKGETLKTSLLREGNKLLHYLTNTAGREVKNLSRLIPAPLKRRQPLGAVMRLRLEVQSGKVLAPDIPAVNTQVGVSGTEEHMNVMRDYQVGLHSKLVESEENRAHMSAFINFEQEAEGEEDLGEYDPSYQVPHNDFTEAHEASQKLSNQRDPRGLEDPRNPKDPLDI